MDGAPSERFFTPQLTKANCTVDTESHIMKLKYPYTSKKPLISAEEHPDEDYNLAL